MEKKCNKCNKILKISEFYNRSDKPHLLQSHCKLCIIKRNNKYIERNINKKKEKDKIYHLKNRNKRIEYLRNYNLKNKNKKALILKNKYANDINYRILTNLRNRIRNAIKRNSKSESTNILIGCSIIDLKLHIESLFKDNMSWDNYGEWQIDHIYPCSRFDLSIYENQLKCFNYKNLQPLWKIDNLLKSNKIIYNA